MDASNKAVNSQKQQPHEPWLVLPGTTIGGEVGTFYIDFVVRNRENNQSRTLTGLVDTGASYTLIPATVLEELGIERIRSRRFVLADGSTHELSIGRVEMELQGETDVVHVIFGNDRNTVLLGAMALEVFALAADAKNRCLIPGQVTI